MDIQNQLDAGFSTIIFRQNDISFAIGAAKFSVVDWKIHKMYTCDYKDLRITGTSNENVFIDFKEQDISTANLEIEGQSYQLHEDKKQNLKTFIEEVSKKISYMSSISN
ncbi:hypothetical protein ACFPYJ_17765 [Paenibacillus solisilvae]|uniref:YokE-like PH domain-containing protein n=1 Tax=Paenibacillus solisilvae TaxID=2486751 RepID=A0ABW0W0Z6_9BACL